MAKSDSGRTKRDVAPMHPSDYFKHKYDVRGGYCFFVMPFAKEFNDVYSTIRSALQQEELAVECHRADEIVGGGEVMADVLRNLAEAELIIVDLTGDNPNVFYELGIAHTLRCKEAVVLIRQTTADVSLERKIPFDVQHYRRIPYQPGPDGLLELGNKLAEMVRNDILPTRFTFDLGEGESSQPVEISGEDGRSSYSFQICDVHLTRDRAARFRLDVHQHESEAPIRISDRVPAVPTNNRAFAIFRSEIVQHWWRTVRRRSQKDISEVHLLQREGRIKIPKTLYALKLHEVKSGVAGFCVCRPEQPAA
jgi:hypothetical protein